MGSRAEEYIPRRRVGVTGLGLVSSLGHDVLSSWENLISGGTGVQDISESHLRGYTDVILTRLGAPVVGFALLNNPALDIQSIRKEKKNFHLSHEYGIEAAYQALGHGPTGAGLLALGSLEIDPELVAHEDVGSYMATGIGGADTLIEIQRKLEAEVRKAQGKALPGDDEIGSVRPSDMQETLIGRPAEILSMIYKTKAFAKMSLGECAASTEAIGEAADKIVSGRAKVVIAGGAEAAMKPATILAFERHKGAVSPSSDASKSPNPLDKNRDGFVFGEGGAVVVLEDLEHAIARGANVYAELIGWGDSADGRDPITPDENGIQRSLNMALGMAGLRASDLSDLYNNVHAPGTPADTTEVAVATRNFKPSQVVGLNSTKGSNGHALGSAGATEAIFTILAIKYGLIPPARNMRNPEDILNGYQTAMGEAVPADVELGLKMSSGFGGHNATLLFRKY